MFARDCMTLQRAAMRHERTLTHLLDPSPESRRSLAGGWRDPGLADVHSGSAGPHDLASSFKNVSRVRSRRLNTTSDGLVGEPDVVSVRGPSSRRLPYADVLVCLDTEPPLGVREAIVDGRRRIGRVVRAVHGLQPEPFEIEVLKPVRHGLGLGEDQL